MLDLDIELIKYTWRFAPDYVGTNKGRIYNTRTKRFAKKTMCGCSVGYWIDRTFRTARELNRDSQQVKPRPLFAYDKKEKLPF